MFTESKAVNEETVKIRQEFVLDSTSVVNLLLGDELPQNHLKVELKDIPRVSTGLILVLIQCMHPNRVFSRFYHILITFVPGTMSREVTSKKNTQSAHCMHV